MVNTYFLQDRGEPISICITFPLDFPPFVFFSAILCLLILGHYDRFVIHQPGYAESHVSEFLLLYISESHKIVTGDLEDGNGAASFCSSCMCC